MKKKKHVTAGELAGMKKPKPVSRQAVHSNKNLPYDLDGNIRLFDLNNSIIKKWLRGESISKPKIKVKPKKNKTTVKKTTVKKKTVKKSAKKKVTKKKTTIKIDDIPNHLKKISDSDQLTFNMAKKLTKRDLECIKIYEQIKDIKAKADERRGGNIDKKVIRTVFSKLYEIDMNQLIPMKEKLLPDLAAIFGCKDQSLLNKAAAKMDDEHYKYLSSVKSVLNKFLRGIKENEVK